MTGQTITRPKNVLHNKALQTDAGKAGAVHAKRYASIRFR